MVSAHPEASRAGAFILATSGNAKDCNVRMIFVDRLTVNGPDGKPAARPSQRYVYLEIPATTDKGEHTLPLPKVPGNVEREYRAVPVRWLVLSGKAIGEIPLATQPSKQNAIS